LAVSVTPDTTFSNLLVAEDTGTVLINIWAFSAYWIDAPDTRRERPAASAALPSASLTMLSSKPASTPVVLDRNNSRSPDASVSTVAVTPALEPLILLATSVTVSVALTSMSTEPPPDCGVNDDGTMVH